jgi:hypothetical protein
MIPSRVAAVLGAVLLSLSLYGCGPGRLHILVPDFLASGVDGLQLFRVLDKGKLQAAGRVVFGAITTTSSGLQMTYKQLVPGSATLGPLQARVRRPAKGQLELELAFFNPGAPAFFRFASYNERGSSAMADGEIYVAGGSQP